MNESVEVTGDIETRPAPRASRELTSLPSWPLPPEQVATIQAAHERVHDVEDSTVWVARDRGTITLCRWWGHTTFGEDAVDRFVIEDPERYQVYRYEPAPGGGSWVAALPAEKGTTVAEIFAQSIDEHGDLELSEILADDGGGR